MSEFPFQPRIPNVAVLFCLPLIAQAQGSISNPLRLEVHIHNYVSAADYELADAFRIAEQVFTSAGIAIEWIDCTAALFGEPAPAPCIQPLRPTSLVVQLPTKRMVKGVPVNRIVFGYAVAAGPGRFSTRASLFYHRIVSYSAANGSSRGALLGMALAHEIGHLLLGRGSHSKSGLMSCPWSKEDIREAARGRLAFEPVQLAQIQERVLARAEAEKTAAVSAD